MLWTGERFFIIVRAALRDHDVAPPPGGSELAKWLPVSLPLGCRRDELRGCRPSSRTQRRIADGRNQVTNT